ncbi:MAG: phosphatase PAP2 family protein, partial [Bdellovibrionales bacterium]|nr:phosphatase PAP2 family protein [Bdellovibrionales bacterium]
WFMFLVFETFFMYLPYFNHNRYDMLLANIDVWLLGVYPTVWMEQWVRPWLTDVMYVVYFLYFPLPFLPLLTLYKRGKWFQLEGAFFSLLVCYYGGYTTYFFVPAMSPIYSLESMHRVPLEGVYFSEPIRGLIDFLEPNKLDVFPSLHTGILLTTMAITWGVSRRMFVWLLPLAAAILVSLVYCRYHYFIDIVAGAALSAASYLISQHLYRRYSTKFVPHFPAE